MIMAGGFAGVGAAVALWPIIDQMNPDASERALATTEIDLAPFREGQAITALWRGKPVFIRHRTIAEIAAARGTRLDELLDPRARNSDLADDAPATDENRTKPGHEQWLVVVASCTHAGCIPLGNRSSEARGDYGGWRCPCHFSAYDTSGRVRRGPAPRNLDVPPYRFLSRDRLLIG